MSGSQQTPWKNFSNEENGFHVKSKVREYAGEPRQAPSASVRTSSPPAPTLASLTRSNRSSTGQRPGSDPSHWALLAGGALAAAVTVMGRKRFKPAVSGRAGIGIGEQNDEAGSGQPPAQAPHAPPAVSTPPPGVAGQNLPAANGSASATVSLKSLTPQKASPVKTGRSSPVHGHGQQESGSPPFRTPPADSEPSPASPGYGNARSGSASTGSRREAVQKLRAQVRAREEIIYELQMELEEKSRRVERLNAHSAQLEAAVKAAHRGRREVEEENSRLREKVKALSQQQQQQSVATGASSGHARSSMYGHREDTEREVQQLREEVESLRGLAEQKSEWQSRQVEMEGELKEAVTSVQQKAAALEESEKERKRLSLLLEDVYVKLSSRSIFDVDQPAGTALEGEQGSVLQLGWMPEEEESAMGKKRPSKTSLPDSPDMALSRPPLPVPLPLPFHSPEKAVGSTFWKEEYPSPSGFSVFSNPMAHTEGSLARITHSVSHLPKAQEGGSTRKTASSLGQKQRSHGSGSGRRSSRSSPSPRQQVQSAASPAHSQDLLSTFDRLTIEDKASYLSPPLPPVKTRTPSSDSKITQRSSGRRNLLGSSPGQDLLMSESAIPRVRSHHDSRRFSDAPLTSIAKEANRFASARLSLNFSNDLRSSADGLLPGAASKFGFKDVGSDGRNAVPTRQSSFDFSDDGSHHDRGSSSRDIELEYTVPQLSNRVSQVTASNGSYSSPTDGYELKEESISGDTPARNASDDEAA